MATNYDQFMAESGQQSTLDEQRRNGTYAQAAAAWRPGSTSSSSGGGGGGGPNYQEVIANAIKMQQEAAKPAISSLNEQIPEVQKAYQTKTSTIQSSIAPLEQRYNSLLASIKNQQTQSVNKQTLATGNELGKRGIPMSSGLSQQELINTTEPVNQYYTGQYQTASSDKEAAIKLLNDQLAQIPDQQSADVRSIKNAIAQLQAGAGSSGISTGLNIYNQQQDQAQQELQNKLAQDQYNLQASQSQQLFPYQLQQAKIQTQEAQNKLNQTKTAAPATGIEKYLQPIGQNMNGSFIYQNPQAASFNASNYKTFTPISGK